MSNITASAPALLPNALGAVGSFLFWWGLYVLTTYCFARWSATKELWSTMTPVQRYSLATCVHSSVHGIIVPVGMFVSLSTCGLWGDFLSGSGLGGGNGSCREAEFVFSWTVGYFLMDGILLLIYRGELWQVFIVHHFVGIMPFFVNCFFYPNLQWAIGGGILIELANPFLNLRTWLDLFGLHNSDRAAYACYLTFAVWVPVRCALPTYLLWGIVNVSVPAFGNEPGWIVTTYITGWAIGVFCYCVCFFVLLPEVIWYARGKHKLAADLVHVPSTADAAAATAAAKASAQTDPVALQPLEDTTTDGIDVEMAAAEPRQRSFRESISQSISGRSESSSSLHFRRSSSAFHVA